MLVLGITGGTGCGKTTVLNCVQARGGCVLDCDEIYHDLLVSEPAMLAAIDARFPGVVQDGALNRRELGKLVFSDPDALKCLNEITHGFVCREVHGRLIQAKNDGCTVAAIDAIGLLESELRDWCDVTVAVTAPEAARIQRLIARENISEEYALSRIRAQHDNDYFIRQCDYTLMNDCPTQAAFEDRINALLDVLLKGDPIHG